MEETIIGKKDREKFFEEPLYKKSWEQRVEHIGFLWEQYNEYDEYDTKLREEFRVNIGGTDKTKEKYWEEHYFIQDVMNDICGEIRKVLQMD